MHPLTPPLRIQGIVQHGDHRGRALGWPTANIACAADIAEGTYAARTTLPTGDVWDSLAFIGSAPTFDRAERFLESHLLDFDGDLYGQTLTVELLAHGRGNERFDGVEALRAAIAADEQAVRQYFTDAT